MSTPKAACSLRGFTLLEVLVALAVLAIALAPAIKMADANAVNTARLEEKTFAHWVAANRITEQQLGKDWPAPGRTGGREPMAGRDWHWIAEVSTTPDADVRRVDVEVRSDPAAEGALVILTGYLARPQ